MKNKKYYLFEMSMGILNVVSLVLFALMVGITLVFYKVGIIHNWNYPIGLIFLLMIPYLILHELLHSFAYVLHGAKFKNVTYGAHLEKGVLCCLCKQNITKKNILISLIYPFVFIGIITYILGIVLDNTLLIALSITNISGCAGDLIMFFDFLFLKDFEYSEYDNPIAFGLYTDRDLSKQKLIGLSYVETKNKLEINDLKKVSISKTSIICFILILVVGLLWMFVN